MLSSPNLKPIQWAQWSGKIEREGRQSEGGGWTREGEEVLGEGDPYEFLGLDGAEGRRGFWDVRVSFPSFLFLVFSFVVFLGEARRGVFGLGADGNAVG